MVEMNSTMVFRPWLVKRKEVADDKRWRRGIGQLRQNRTDITIPGRCPSQITLDCAWRDNNAKPTSRSVPACAVPAVGPSFALSGTRPLHCLGRTAVDHGVISGTVPGNLETAPTPAYQGGLNAPNISGLRFGARWRRGSGALGAVGTPLRQRLSVLLVP